MCGRCYAVEAALSVRGCDRGQRDGSTGLSQSARHVTSGTVALSASVVLTDVSVFNQSDQQIGWRMTKLLVIVFFFFCTEDKLCALLIVQK